jgi:ribosomal protein L37AE/L43A
MTSGPLTSPTCPTCGKAMVRAGTIWRAFQDDIEIWQCHACDETVRQTAKVGRLPAQELASWHLH